MKTIQDSGFRIHEKGFTLLELLIYLGVLSVLAVVIAGTFVPFQRGRGLVIARGEVHTNMNFAVEKIAQDIRVASPAMMIPGSAGASSSTFEFTHPTDGTVRWCVVSGRLYRATDAACDGTGDSVITPDTVTVATPTFTRLENATGAPLNVTIISIQIDLTMSYNNPSPDWQYSENKKTSVTLR